MITADRPTAGALLRQWRQQRRLSQMELALDAEISQRHLSCLEVGRSMPSRAMVLRLSERLRVPLRERNAILAAAGHAPSYAERPLQAPEMAAARGAIGRILAGHMPHPALAVDRHWMLLEANAAVLSLLAGVPAGFLAAPVNVLRLSLHPEGLAPSILNYPAWRAHVLARLEHEAEVSGDAVLLRLLDELAALPPPPQARGMRAKDGSAGEIAVPLVLDAAEGPLSFYGTTTVFGTAVDVTLSEVTIEAFFPADPATAAAMAARAAG